MTNSPSQSEAQPEVSEDTPVEAESGKGWSPNVSRRRIIVAVFVILAGVFAALYAWDLPPFAGGDETTNNAYVRGRTTVVSPQVAGYLTEVPVTDFQRVEEGDLLARIDDAPFQQKVLQGSANSAAQQAALANSAQSLRSAQAQLKLQTAAVTSARAALQKAQADMNHIAELVDEGSVSLRERDQARAALQQAQAGVQQAEAQRAIAAENVRSVTVGRGGLEAQVAGAEASKDLADFHSE